MKEREHVRPGRSRRPQAPAEEATTGRTAEAADLEATDALLDEIDEILDMNHIGEYVQKGGE